MKIKKIFFLQSISNVLSVLAVVMALLSLLFASSLKNKINKKASVENKQKFVSINSIPDVEVVKIDGSIAKINATNSHDMIGDLLKRNEIDGKRANKTEDSKKENVKNNSVNENNSAVVNVKNNDIINKVDDVNVDKIEVKKVVPVSRNNISTMKNNKKNNVKKKNVNRIDNNKKNIHSKFLVQTSAFRSKELAEKQCKKIKEFDSVKHCFVSPSAKGQFYRTMVAPFNTYRDALDFANKLSIKLNINCFVKKNS